MQTSGHGRMLILHSSYSRRLEGSREVKGHPVELSMAAHAFNLSRWLGG